MLRRVDGRKWEETDYSAVEKSTVFRSDHPEKDEREWAEVPMFVAAARDCC